MKAEAKMAAPMKIEKNLNNYAFIGEFKPNYGLVAQSPLSYSISIFLKGASFVTQFNFLCRDCRV